MTEILPVDKRRHKRIPIAASVNTAPKGGEEGETLPALAANISSSGIGIYCDRSLEPETVVSLSVHFVSKDGEISIDTLGGSVVYVKKIGNMYFMGIELEEEVNKARQPFLHKHLLSALAAD